MLYASLLHKAFLCKSAKQCVVNQIINRYFLSAINLLFTKYILCGIIKVGRYITEDYMNNRYGSNVLITGASSGIGNATAHTLAKMGFHVYGISRRGGDDISYDTGFLKMIKADVTNDESVSSAVEFVLNEAGSIDILINAAGTGICGAVDECNADDALMQMNTNYLGVIRMINAVVPHMRSRKSGFVINIGSVGGIFAIPFQSLYSSSKYAVEALTECLRIELKPFGVKACLVEPGDIKTNFTAARTYTEKAKNSDYGEPFRKAIAQMEKDEQNGASPQIIANAIVKIIRKKNPPVRKVVGGMYSFFTFLKRILPARTVEFILTAMYPNSKN